MNGSPGDDPRRDPRPTRFEDMRRGCWDIDARIADMDLNGVWASLNFPSQITGFSGSVFTRASDPGLGLAVTRAWNDWLFEAWWQPYPDRIIPCGSPTSATPSTRPPRSENADGASGRSPCPSDRRRSASPACSPAAGTRRGRLCGDRHRHLAARRLHGMPDLPVEGPLVALGATLFGQMSLTACAEWLVVRPTCPVPGLRSP